LSTSIAILIVAEISGITQHYVARQHFIVWLIQHSLQQWRCSGLICCGILCCLFWHWYWLLSYLYRNSDCFIDSSMR